MGTACVLWLLLSISQSPKRLGDGDLFVGAEDVAHGVADFAEGGVGFYGVVDEGHQVFGAFGGVAESAEAAVYFRLGAAGAQFAEAFGLAVSDRFVDLQILK